MKKWSIQFTFEHRKSDDDTDIFPPQAQAALTHELTRLSLAPSSFEGPQDGNLIVVFETDADTEWAARQQAAQIADAIAAIKMRKVSLVDYRLRK